MKHSDVMGILAHSSQDEWVVDDESGTFSYKEDLNLQIIRTPYEYQTDFNESWATRYPDPNARKVDYEVKYRDSVVARKTMISVDGHRAELPLTKAPNDLTVTKSDVNFARITATGGNAERLESYLKRSEITIVEDSVE